MNPQHHCSRRDETVQHRRLIPVIVALAERGRHSRPRWRNLPSSSNLSWAPALASTLSTRIVSSCLARGYVTARATRDPQYESPLHHDRASDYVSRDWTYDITFVSPASAPDDILFIGIGEAVPDSSYFSQAAEQSQLPCAPGLYGFSNGWREWTSRPTAWATAFSLFSRWGVGNLPRRCRTPERLRRASEVRQRSTFPVLGTNLGKRSRRAVFTRHFSMTRIAASSSATQAANICTRKCACCQRRSTSAIDDQRVTFITALPKARSERRTPAPFRPDLHLEVRLGKRSVCPSPPEFLTSSETSA